MAEAIPAVVRLQGALLLRIEPLLIAPTLELRGRRFAAKREFHVTLLDRETLAAIGKADALRAARSLPFAVQWANDYWLVKRGRAESVIRMCCVDRAAAFFDSLGLGEPPLHVTLYTAGDARGIGIRDREMLHAAGELLAGDDRETVVRAAVRESTR